jgi:hypothetical protein
VNSSVISVLIVLALVALSIYRQFTWQAVNGSKLWRMPLIVGVIGVVMLVQTKNLGTVTATDVTVLAVEIVIALGLGAAMGSQARFRSRGQTAADVDAKKGEVHDPNTTVIESRTGAIGVGFWIVLILVRITAQFVIADFFPSVLLASTGTILIVLAANRAARAAVVITTMQRRGLITA